MFCCCFYDEQMIMNDIKTTYFMDEGVLPN